MIGFESHGLEEDGFEVWVNAPVPRRTADVALSDAGRDLVGEFGVAVRGLFAKDFVKNDAERVEVGLRGDAIFAADLLRARILGGHAIVTGFGQALLFVAGSEKAGDAEVEQAWVALRSDEDVGGFQVAVDDQIAVGDGHGFGDLEEDVEALLDGLVMGVLIEGDSLDELHDDVGGAFGGLAGLVEAGDIGMFALGEDLDLTLEALEVASRRRAASAIEEFDGDGASGGSEGASGGGIAILHRADDTRDGGVAGGIGEVRGRGLGIRAMLAGAALGRRGSGARNAVILLLERAVALA